MACPESAPVSSQNQSILPAPPWPCPHLDFISTGTIVSGYYSHDNMFSLMLILVTITIITNATVIAPSDLYQAEVEAVSLILFHVTFSSVLRGKY